MGEYVAVSDDRLPAGALIKVEMEVRLPASATYEEVEDWLYFELGRAGGLDMNNPLAHNEPEAWGDIFLDYRGEIGRTEEFDHKEHADGSKTYKVRYLRERAS